MNNYQIISSDDNVNISLHQITGDKDKDYLESFIDIWVDDDDLDSPFKSVDDAVLFAEMIVKLLKVVS